MVVFTLNLGQRELINIPNSSENATWLSVDWANNDGLLHAPKGHSKQENASDLQVNWQVDKDFSKSSDLQFIAIIKFKIGLWRWNGNSTHQLQIFDSTQDILEFWGLNRPTKDLLRLIHVPQLDLKNELFEGRALHLWLVVEWQAIQEQLWA